MPTPLRSIASRSWAGLPAILSFLLLAFQAVMPWLSVSFVTQDGPSHLYTAAVARDLLLNSNSPYAAVYRFQPKLVTNWSTTVLMNVMDGLFGASDAEHAMATLCVIAGFFGFAYLRRSVDPLSSPWSPTNNFLLCTWFLWIGFYNFYLGMALFPFVAGYYIRHANAMNPRRTGLLTLGLVVLFFTHVMPFALALLLIGLAGVWVFGRMLTHGDSIRVAAGWLAAVLLPSTILLLVFVRGSGQTTAYDPAIAWAWNSFPMHAFAASQGKTGEQTLLVAAMLFYMIVGLLAMRRNEWTSPKACLFVGGAFSFVIYLLTPDSGFGGDAIKIRFAWAVFVFGCLAASTVTALLPLRIPVAIFTTCFLTATLFQAFRLNVRHVSRAVKAYEAALSTIPPGSTFVRLRFPTETTRKRLGYETVALEPLFHLDARVAARRKLVDISDYQALTRLFPLDHKPLISATQRFQLWDLEGSGTTGPDSLKQILKDFPVRIDYIVVLGDGTPAEKAAELDPNMRLIAVNPGEPFVRVYRRLP
jgi:hypothetical protein